MYERLYAMLLKTFLILLVIVVYNVCECCDVANQCSEKENNDKPPHIIIIVADDLGWNDVGYHGSAQLRTPNIDALAYAGLQLHAHYTQPLCTPSRAALLTGKYPIHTGTQHLVILESTPWGLPDSERLLPELLQARGYRRHAVGKWHLGSHRAALTPTERGFESHYGYWNGFQDYYTHYVEATYNKSLRGYDMRRDLAVDLAGLGRYAPHLYTEEAVRVISRHDRAAPLLLYLAQLAPHAGPRAAPLAPPPNPPVWARDIMEGNRRAYAGMVSALDDSVGAVLAALQRRDMLCDSVVLFLSDNGAPTKGVHANYGSNYPLRGQKNTPWEGGIRNAAVLWTPKLATNPRLYKHPIHISDWYPTLYRAAGGDPAELKNLDGIDAWQALHEDLPARHEFLINIDQSPGNSTTIYSAIRMGPWKLVEGRVNENEWLGDSGAGFRYHWDAVLNSPVAKALEAIGLPLNSSSAVRRREVATVKCQNLAPRRQACNPRQGPCLYNINIDPCENVDLSSTRRDIVVDLQKRLRELEATAVHPGNKPSDAKCDPSLWGGVWASWTDAVHYDNKTIADSDVEMKLKEFNMKFRGLHQSYGHRGEVNHWEIVGMAAGVMALFMVSCSIYALRKKSRMLKNMKGLSSNEG